MNIVLIGYRGTGKSVVGEILGSRLGMNYVGMDKRIVETAGMSIPEIVEKYGWPGFRDMESKVVLQLSACDHLIIDTGGGVIERPENIKALKGTVTIFWLKASVDTIINSNSGRHSKAFPDCRQDFYRRGRGNTGQRIPKYKIAAQFEIDTDNLTPVQVADKIMDILHI
jgi:shikimate kinase